MDIPGVATIELAAPARRAATHLIKMRARRYARHPQALDTLHPGLSLARAETLIAIAAHLVERESRSPRRWFGFGGEVNLVNARAALLVGRVRRRRSPATCWPKQNDPPTLPNQEDRST